MKEFNIATEKGIRYLDKENAFYYFVSAEFIFKKDNLTNGNYRITYKSEGKIFYEQNLEIDITNKLIKIENSHEDPLVESDECFFICGQLTKEIIEENKINNDIECLFYLNEKLLRKEKIKSNVLSYLFSLEEWNSFLTDGNKIFTKKPCIIRLHLGKKNKDYKEEEFKLEANKMFLFEKYLQDYDYLAVQCAYEIDYEVDYDLEEKHIIKGLKGIINSDYLEINGNVYYPIIPFSRKYSNKSKEEYILINSISDLINFYSKNPEYINKTFEMNENFLLMFYKQYQTTAVGKIYSSLVSKKNHLESNCCEVCQEKSKCLQLVPSGLSESLFRKNLLVENFENCCINKIIKIVKE